MKRLLIGLSAGICLVGILFFASEPLLSWTNLDSVLQDNPAVLSDNPETIDMDILIQAISQLESGDNHKARSRRGARGILQIRAPTWRWVCKNRLKVNWNFREHAYDSQKNIAVGRAYLEYLMERFDSVDAALVAYNCGPGHYVNNQVPLTTQEYLVNVKALYADLKATAESIAHPE
jgi:membrane-bound lytic murein transglycosylase MltF